MTNSRVETSGLIPEGTSLTATGLLPLLHTWFALSRQRRALRELAGDGHRLSDIGLTREQALCEAAKPFWRR